MFSKSAKLAISEGWDGKWGVLHSLQTFLYYLYIKKKKSTKHFYNYEKTMMFISIFGKK